MQHALAPVGPGGPKQILRLNPQSGKGWMESTDSSSEELFVQFCGYLYERFPEPKLSEEELYNELSALAVPDEDGAEGDSWLEVFRQKMLDLQERTGYHLSIYEAWWTYCHASLFAEEMAIRSKMAGARKMCEKQVSSKMGNCDYDPRRFRSSVKSVWSFFCERFAAQEIGVVALVLANRAISGDVQAITAYNKAYNPIRTLTRSETSVAFSRTIEREIDPDGMTEEEVKAAILKFTKEVGGEAQNPMSKSTILDKDS